MPRAACCMLHAVFSVLCCSLHVVFSVLCCSLHVACRAACGIAQARRARRQLPAHSGSRGERRARRVASAFRRRATKPATPTGRWCALGQGLRVRQVSLTVVLDAGEYTIVPYGHNQCNAYVASQQSPASVCVQPRMHIRRLAPRKVLLSVHSAQPLTVTKSGAQWEHIAKVLQPLSTLLSTPPLPFRPPLLL
jgi:hypothetical protein